jgi:hypothetical protein
MTNSDDMHATLLQVEAGVNEFLRLWVLQLEDDQHKILHDWLEKGLRLGLHFLPGGPVNVVLVDERGGSQVLVQVKYTTARVPH